MAPTLNDLRETAKLFTYFFMQLGDQQLAMKSATFKLEQQQGNKLVNIELDTTDGTVSNQYRFATLEKEIREQLESSQNTEAGTNAEVMDKAAVKEKLKGIGRL